MTDIYEVTVLVRAETSKEAQHAVAKAIEDQISSGKAAKLAGVKYVSIGKREG